jgi:sporulation protein YlmC with PRC-barrel domain
MWQHARDLIGYGVSAADGALGSVEDLYLDDERWTVRYLVVNTGNWLTGRLVLVSPIAVGRIDRGSATVAVGLTREQVERSPSPDAHRPVSRQYEAEYAAYYGYPAYWSGPELWGLSGLPQVVGLTTVERQAAETAVTPPAEDAHLRSALELKGYTLEAVDGDIGHLQDLVIDVDTWAVRLIIVDTSTWWLGRRVLIPPDWIRDIRWADRRAQVDVAREAVRSSPEWDKRQSIDEQYEQKLSAHYGRALGGRR